MYDQEREAYRRFGRSVEKDWETAQRYIRDIAEQKLALENDSLYDLLDAVDALIVQRDIVDEQLVTFRAVFTDDLVSEASVNRDGLGRPWIGPVRTLFVALENLSTRATHIISLSVNGTWPRQGRGNDVMEVLKRFARVLRTKLAQLASEVAQLIANLPLPTQVEGMSFSVGGPGFQMAINLVY